MSDFYLQDDFYKQIFENSIDCIFLLKEDRMVEFNRATLELFDCTREQLSNHTPYSFSPQYQPDGESSETKSKRLIFLAYQGQPQQFEWLHHKHDGSSFYADVNLTAIESNQQRLLLATVREITARKKFEAELDQSREQVIAQNDSLYLLHILSKRLHECTSQNDILDVTSRSLRELARTPHVALSLFNPNKQCLALYTSAGYNRSFIKTSEQMPIRNSLAGLALEQQKVIFSEDFSHETRSQLVQRMVEYGFHSGVVIPLLISGHKFGVITLSYPDKRSFTYQEIETFTALSTTVGIALERLKHAQELEYLAHYDELTGLSNRRVLHDMLNTSIKHSPEIPITLMLIDLDRFKEVNDTLGHHFGDELLKQIGPRLKNLSCHKLEVSRLGGDEFILHIYAISDAEHIHQLARESLRLLREVFIIEQQRLEIDASIGISRYPQDGNNSHELLRKADVAMYTAKTGEEAIEYYAPAKDQHSPARLSLISELNFAIQNDQLQLYFQPQVRLLDYKIIGFEALVRWNHPQLGLLMPSYFMPFVEVSDNIHGLTQRVLREALKQQKQWIDQGQVFSIAVNLSARNLSNSSLFEQVRDVLCETQGNPELLELEITETALMQDPDQAVKLLNQIAELGVTLAVDDYGTGYSSLSYLKRLPLKRLKIDRLFVNDMLYDSSDEIIVRSTVTLAHNLGLKVIAEGVENSKTLAQLRELTCDTAQGFFISPPIEQNQLDEWLNLHGQKFADGEGVFFRP